MAPLNKIIRVRCDTCDEAVMVLIWSTVQTSMGTGKEGEEVYRTEVGVAGAACAHDQTQLLEKIKAQIDAGIEPMDGIVPVVREEEEVTPRTLMEAQAAVVEATGAEPDETVKLVTVTTYVADAPMEVFEVYYKRLISFGNYEHEELGMRANVPVRYDENGYPHGTADPMETIGRLRLLVNAGLSAQNKAEAISNDILHLDSKRRQMRADLVAMKKQWEAMKAFLEKIGLTPDAVRHLFNDGDLDDVPF